ncbi:spore germination protein GerPC [Jeotgalibacillus proteolyticus]|uniref:spore germination protein GerPC n=1 Tax=Jeotgalibacillus proteolyticus TaxID=2082395 RepID=UPI003CE8D6F1
MQQVYYQLAALQQQLTQCMERLSKIEQKLEERASSPSSVHIEKIEYKFDQLKVETLEGTLSIGLSPSDLYKQDVEIPGFRDSVSIEDQIRQYIHEQIPTVFSDCSIIHDPAGKPITPDQVTDQLMQQLPQRIEHLQQGASITQEQLLLLVQRDVAHALHALRSQQPFNQGVEGQ